jgi:hypothetical protein
MQLNKNRVPCQSYNMGDFIERLPALGAERLANVLAVRAETDEVLRKVLSVSLAIQASTRDFSEVSDVIDDAIDIPEFVPHPEGRNEMILDEILLKIQELEKFGNIPLARQIAEYSVQKAIKMQEQFEEGFAWSCSLEKIEKWLAETGGTK